MRSLSPCARCRLHTSSPDLSTIRPPSIWPVLDHPWSSKPGLLLLPWSSSLPVMPHLSPACHETSKHDSPHKTKIKVKPPKLPRIEFKSRQVNYSSQLNQCTNDLVSQSPPWWVHWQQKAQSLNFESKTHEAQLQEQKSKESLRRSSRRRKHRKASKRHEKRQIKQKGKEELRKAHNSP
jgi:hypothetical protein